MSVDQTDVVDAIGVDSSTGGQDKIRVIADTYIFILLNILALFSRNSAFTGWIHFNSPCLYAIFTIPTANPAIFDGSA